MYLEYYLNELEYNKRPNFIDKYLSTPSLLRLKSIGYFCGMDYASPDIYNFRETISRYDHSLTVALITYKLTHDKRETLAGLFHDIATPCFSHVIDYMNKDYQKQESTEEYTEKILKEDSYLNKCLKIDDIDIKDIINFKNYSIVDNERPKVCADRIDGVILTDIGWTKKLNLTDISNIVENMEIFINENKEKEIGFKSLNVAKKVVDTSKSIDLYCHSNEDNYMMELLAKITRYAIKKEYITYNNLYYYSEKELFKKLKSLNDDEINKWLYLFENIKRTDIPQTELINVKVRKLNPLINNKRYYK
jgi:uncharacterized protein